MHLTYLQCIHQMSKSDLSQITRMFISYMLAEVKWRQGRLQTALFSASGEISLPTSIHDRCVRLELQNRRRSKCTALLSHLTVTLMEAEAVAQKCSTEQPRPAGYYGVM